MQKRITYCFCFCLLVLLKASAQDPLDEKSFTLYTTLDGLSDNSITGLIQDEKGFIWIATKNGLNRFDGFEFRKFYQTSDPQSLIIDEIRKMSGHDNELLLMTRKGCQLFNTNSFRFAQYTLPETEPGYYYKNAVSDALITEEGEVLMSTATGLYVFNKSGELNFRYDKYMMKHGEAPPKNYGQNIVLLRDNMFMHFIPGKEMFIFDNTLKKYASAEVYRSMFPNLAALNKKIRYFKSNDQAHEMILYDDATKELLFYDPKTDNLKRCKLPDFLYLEIKWPSRFYAVNDSTVILTSAHNGLFIGHRNVITGDIQFDPKRYFADYFCSTVFKDKEGRLWIGSENGLLKQNLSEKRVGTIDLKTFSQEKSGKSNYEITAFLRHQHELYVGTYGRECVYVLNADDYTYRQRISFAGIDPKCNQVWHILPAAKDTLWFATQGGLLWLTCNSKNFGIVQLPKAIQPYIYGKPVTIAFKDSHGLIWLQGAWGTGLIQYNPLTRHTRVFQYKDSINHLPIPTLDHITEDNEENLWLASRGLIRWNRKTDKFDTTITTYTGLNKKNIPIRTLTSDSRHRLVFSNLNNGVVFFDPQNRVYNHLTTPHGLPENAVHVLLGSYNGLVWIGSRNYVSVHDQHTQKTISYTYSDGVPLEGGTPVSMYHDTVAGRVLIGYNNTSIAYVADNLPPEPAESIPFFIDEINIISSHNIIYPDKELKLTHQENDIHIHLSAINFSDVQNNQFHYRLHSTSWIPLGKLNSVTLNNMTPGVYTLQIKVSSPTNRWKDAERQITIIVKPPFWQTAWFYAASLLAIVTIVFVFIRNHIRTIRRTSELNNSLVMAEMKALHAQMNPHFIFNSLNSIKEMILQNEKDNASRYLSRFAQLIRMNLDHSRQNLITLEQNIQYLERYLEIEKLRFDDFTYTISVDANLDASEIEIPSMLLQPLVENALWHGLKTKTGSKEIAIRFQKHHDQLLCEIEDNGIGINQSRKEKNGVAHQSFGLDNIRERISLFNSKYRNYSRLDISDLSSLSGQHKKGTLVRLTLSLSQD